MADEADKKAALRKKRVSLGVVDDKFLSAYQQPQRAGPRSGMADGANKEVSLSQARSKALARLGASEEAGGPANAYVAGGPGRKGRRPPLLPLLFHDPEVEAEYRMTAYIMHRAFLVWMLLLFGVAYATVAVVTLVHDLRDSSPVSPPIAGAAAAVRCVAVLACVIGAVLVLGNRLTLRMAQVWTALTLLALWAAPLTAAAMREYTRECPELLLLCFASYGVLCPAFHIRLVATILLVLCAANALLITTAFAYAEPLRPVVLNVFLRELLKAVVVNAMGIWLARRSERSHRETFVNAKLFQEELMLRKAVCNDVQRLLLNTLPEPIVREIATGTSRIAHRYDNVTVLQADMVGFTPLSAARGPEEVLGILSELFADFDQAAERWGVHKVKTIGDAYIVCCGAFVCTDDQQEAARRIVNMALSMQYIVSQKAFERGIDISVRIGVHTGMVIGGIIGTVRFHFDMWGNGVAGAVRLEELGVRGRVHISDCTADLIKDKFALDVHIGEGDESEKLEEGFGISRTYLVNETHLNLASYALRHDSVTVANDYDYSEVLGSNINDQEVELAIDEVLVKAKQDGNKHFLSMLKLPRITPARREKTRRGNGPGGRGEVTNAIAFMKKLAGEDLTSKTLAGAMFGTSAGMFSRKRLSSDRGDVSKQQSGGGSSTADEEKKAGDRPVRRDGRHGSISLTRNFFVKKTDVRHSMSASGNAAVEEKKAADDNVRMVDAKRFLTRQAEVLVAVVVCFGLYDFLCGYVSAIFVSNSEIASLLIVRYCGLVPALLLTRQLISTSGSNVDDAPTPTRVLAFSLSLIAVPTAALIAQIAVAGDEIRPCAHLANVLPCPGADFAPPSAPPVSLTAVASIDAGVGGRMCALGGAATGYCKVGYNGDYVRTLGMLSIVCHYMLVYSRLYTVMTASMISSVVALVLIAITHQQRYPGVESYHLAAQWNMSDFAELAMWWLLAHLVGLLHYWLRFFNLFQSELLRKRHYRLLASIREETEHCEQLLKNILPPHVLVHLSGLLVHADHAAKGNRMPSKTLAERYHNCSFLFAKIGGLSRLVNDDAVDPKDMMTVLQIMFDRFDALADMFGVQKVRKTANEYYLVAAGLPNPRILPSAEDRACGIAGFGFAMINIMNIINLELEQYGINFTCQVGIHSGSAIAGIIGHKTFQYDLCGDAVNTAARMCSYSKPGHINISEATHQLLNTRYGAVPRGELNVKGKGKMNTYFLLNMPVEQQETLKALSAPTELNAAVVQVVDRWAKRAHNHEAAKGGKSGHTSFEEVSISPASAGTTARSVGTARSQQSTQRGNLLDMVNVRSMVETADDSMTA